MDRSDDMEDTKDDDRNDEMTQVQVPKLIHDD